MSNVEWLGEEDGMGVGQVRFAQRFSATPYRGVAPSPYPRFAQRPSATPFRGRAPQLYSGRIAVTCPGAPLSAGWPKTATTLAQNVNDSLELLRFANKTQQWIADRISYVAQAMAGTITVPRPSWWLPGVFALWPAGPNHGCAIQALDQNGNMILGVAGPPGVGAVDWFEGEPQWGDHGSPGLGGVGLGQPASSCPAGTAPNATFTACREEARQGAQSICQAAWAQAQAQAQATAGQPGAPTATQIFQQMDFGSSVTSCTNQRWAQLFADFNCIGNGCSPTLACVDPNVIALVQDLLNRPETGVWSQGDQDALAAAGATFKDFSPNCSGPVPVPAVGGAPVIQPPITPPPAPTAKKGGAGLGVVLLAAAAAVAIAMAQS